MTEPRKPMRRKKIAEGEWSTMNIERSCSERMDDLASELGTNKRLLVEGILAWFASQPWPVRSVIWLARDGRAIMPPDDVRRLIVLPDAALPTPASRQQRRAAGA